MAKAIDLSYEIYSGMEVYPGDPEVRIETHASIKQKGYKVSRILFGTHTATHVDAESHMIEKGKALSDHDITRFMGNAVLISKEEEIAQSEVLIIKGLPFTGSVIKKVLKFKPKIIGFTPKNEPDIKTTRQLLENGIILAGPLKIENNLPKKFLFCAFPLKIRNGDGSPVRAVAIVDL